MIPLPKGFLAAGVQCGVRRSRPDLGLIVSEQPSLAAGVFTQNTCAAAPVIYSRDLLPAEHIKAIITNSGEANAATGPQGEKDNQQMVETVAAELGCNASQVLAASTGVIGQVLSIKKICTAVPALVKDLSHQADDFSQAILTTDLVAKTATKKVTLNGGDITITGVSKGSGMIHPNMATMLGYLLTDVKLSSLQIRDLLKVATDQSFNMISVDGETSTNDAVFMLANGASDISLETQEDYYAFQTALNEISIELAKKIVQDGEGASKVIQIEIQQAPSIEFARRVVRELTTSPLIKTAIHGRSPNWGRIIARLGFAQIAPQLLDQCTIIFQGMEVYHRGQQRTLSKDELKKRMEEDNINITIDLANGTTQATGWTCDLSANYIKINAEYVT